MHAEPAEHAEAPAPVAPSGNYPEAKTSREWAIGTLFVLAAVALVVFIALAIVGLAG